MNVNMKQLYVLRMCNKDEYPMSHPEYKPVRPRNQSISPSVHTLQRRSTLVPFDPMRQSLFRPTRPSVHISPL